MDTSVIYFTGPQLIEHMVILAYTAKYHDRSQSVSACTRIAHYGRHHHPPDYPCVIALGHRSIFLLLFLSSPSSLWSSTHHSPSSQQTLSSEQIRTRIDLLVILITAVLVPNDPLVVLLRIDVPFHSLVVSPNIGRSVPRTGDDLILLRMPCTVPYHRLVTSQPMHRCSSQQIVH